MIELKRGTIAVLYSAYVLVVRNLKNFRDLGSFLFYFAGDIEETIDLVPIIYGLIIKVIIKEEYR